MCQIRLVRRLKSAVDKLVDEYLKGVVTYKYPFAGSGASDLSEIFQILHKDADPTIGLHKVRNLRCEQKDLESSAKDSESLVC